MKLIAKSEIFKIWIWTISVEICKIYAKIKMPNEKCLLYNFIFNKYNLIF